MSNRVDLKKYPYRRTRVRGPDGTVRYSANNRDAVARGLLGLDKDALVQVMGENGLSEKISKHVESKNLGHFRMILGQTLRVLSKRGVVLRIGKLRIKSLDQEVPLAKGFVEEKIKYKE